MVSRWHAPRPSPIRSSTPPGRDRRGPPLAAPPLRRTPAGGEQRRGLRPRRPPVPVVPDAPSRRAANPRRSAVDCHHRHPRLHGGAAERGAGSRTLARGIAGIRSLIRFLEKERRRQRRGAPRHPPSAPEEDAAEATVPGRRARGGRPRQRARRGTVDRRPQRRDPDAALWWRPAHLRGVVAHARPGAAPAE